MSALWYPSTKGRRMAEGKSSEEAADMHGVCLHLLRMPYCWSSQAQHVRKSSTNWHKTFSNAMAQLLFSSFSACYEAKDSSISMNSNILSNIFFPEAISVSLNGKQTTHKFLTRSCVLRHCGPRSKADKTDD